MKKHVFSVSLAPLVLTSLTACLMPSYEIGEDATAGQAGGAGVAASGGNDGSDGGSTGSSTGSGGAKPGGGGGQGGTGGKSGKGGAAGKTTSGGMGGKAGTSGTAGKGGSSDPFGAGGSGNSGGAAGAGGTAGTTACTDGGTNYGPISQATCTACQNTEFVAGGCCVSQGSACSSNTDCIAIIQCINTCSDQACANDCATKNPKGVSDFDAVYSCFFGDVSSSVGACGTVCGTP
jgi:hypothetical protein